MKYIYVDSFQIHSNTDQIGFFVSPNIQGLDMSSLRVATFDKPGEWGGIMSNQLYGSRLITFQGKVFSNSLADFNMKRRSLESACQITKDSNSIPIPHTIKIKTMDDLELQIDGYINNFKMAVDNLLVSDFLLEFYCPDFSLLSQTLNMITFTPPSGGGVTYPVIYPAVYAAATGGLKTLANNGTTISYPTITLNGTLTNPTITNYTTGRYIALNMTVTSGNPVVIDMKNKTILQGSTPVIGNKILASDWWWLESGNNQISVVTGNPSDNGNVVISYQDAYLGI